MEPNSVDDLVQAIDKLWNDQELRERLGQEAARYTAENCSDEAAGSAMGRILDQVANETHLG
ncbi:MAG: hypothetical protein KME25_22885 [Symplocastrum torsivum CPER-KK1]|uniref:Uncharacterized protein n=1 Tax=Symplocastrum torsivum CPER-KK1 TaxID=450513 RepID=A0A951UBS5_9CYAN|nr:hypothetical protein [Symplocastrum torsivum CPER-KK1]